MVSKRKAAESPSAVKQLPAVVEGLEMQVQDSQEDVVCPLDAVRTNDFNLKDFRKAESLAVAKVGKNSKKYEAGEIILVRI